MSASNPQYNRKLRRKLREVVRGAVWQRQYSISSRAGEPDKSLLDFAKRNPAEALKIFESFAKKLKRDSRQLNYTAQLHKEVDRLYLLEKDPKQRKLIEMQRARQKIEYKHEVELLRHRIPNSLMAREPRSIAQQKLNQLLSNSVVVCRVENVARVISQLKKTQPMAGEEAFYLEDPHAWLEKWKNVNLSPTERSVGLMDWASRHVDWHTHLYNCMVLYHSDAMSDDFRRIRDIKKNPWGETFLRATEHPSILGIMVFDPRPETLVQVATQIAKRRSKDPLVVFDNQGNVFYP